jgi:general secretion pathway protein L
MKELTLFWGNHRDEIFTWHTSKNSTSGSAQKPLHQLESHEILKADLPCLAEMAADCSVTLVLSADDVMSALVSVPNKAQRLLRKAVPYMLEDELASSVDDLFFALADKPTDSKLQVRAIDRAYLEELLDQFKQAEIRLSKVCLDLDLLALPAEGYSVVVAESNVLVVGEDGARWHCHPDDFSWLIQKQISEAEDDDSLPVAVPLQVCSDREIDQFVHNLPVGRFAVEQTSLETTEEFLSEQENTAINLLQAEFEPKSENSALTKFLFRVATLAAVVLATHLIFQSVNIYTLSEQKAQLDAQKITLYKQAFPGSRQFRGIEKKMRQHIKSLGTGSGEIDFLSLLNSSTELMTDLEKIYPTNISYDHVKRELRMDVIASDLVSLDQFADALKKDGHQVEKSSETQRGDGYSSRLIISK